MTVCECDAYDNLLSAMSFVIEIEFGENIDDAIQVAVFINCLENSVLARCSVILARLSCFLFYSLSLSLMLSRPMRIPIETCCPNESATTNEWRNLGTRRDFLLLRCQQICQVTRYPISPR